MVEGCISLAHARGLCNRHYLKWRKGAQINALSDGRKKHAGCSVGGCDRPHYGRGYCSLHYARWKKHGDALRTRPRRGCSVEGCDRPHSCKGLCAMHYLRLWSRGSTDDPVRPSLKERFWNRVDKEGPIPAEQPDLGPCWLWTAGRFAAGYGEIRGEDGKPKLCHRLAYEWLMGPIPPYRTIDHLCYVKHCVNPTHMEVVTNAENARRGAIRRHSRRAKS